MTTWFTRRTFNIAGSWPRCPRRHLSFSLKKYWQCFCPGCWRPGSGAISCVVCRLTEAEKMRSDGGHRAIIWWKELKIRQLRCSLIMAREFLDSAGRDHFHFAVNHLTPKTRSRGRVSVKTWNVWNRTCPRDGHQVLTTRREQDILVGSFQRSQITKNYI